MKWSDITEDPTNRGSRDAKHPHAPGTFYSPRADEPGDGRGDLGRYNWQRSHGFLGHSVKLADGNGWGCGGLAFNAIRVPQPVARIWALHDGDCLCPHYRSGRPRRAPRPREN